MGEKEEAAFAAWRSKRQETCSFCDGDAEIARLSAENSKLREALHLFLDKMSDIPDDPPYESSELGDYYSWALALTWDDLRKARAALNPK